ncbi:MAG TPA: hypothetical protein VH234_02575 [Candidatus Saccharimonadales bacterium]|jgi:hypothetical protein|nr:hypothetical protein [Candidatus Saccharimonadales bacterium]
MSKSTPSAIRLSITDDISRALSKAKMLYPTLSDPEILKLGLSKIVRESDRDHLTSRERDEIRRFSAHSVGEDYLRDPAEDLYTSDMGKKVQF